MKKKENKENKVKRLKKKEKKVKTQKKDPIIKNPKVRKGLIWGGTLVTIAGITVAITVPLVLEEQNKANINAFSKEALWDGMSLANFEQNIKELGVKDRSILDKSLFAIKEKLYEKQVKAQEEYIKLFYEDYDNKKLSPGFSDSDVPTKMKTLDEVREDRRKFLQQEEATFKQVYSDLWLVIRGLYLDRTNVLWDTETHDFCVLWILVYIEHNLVSKIMGVNSNP